MEMVSLQVEIFLLIGCGYLLAKKKMISKQTRKQLTSLVINLILPAAIIKSFETNITWEIIQSCIWVFIASILIQVFYAVMMRLFWNRIPNPKKRVCLDYGTMVSNAGFMGMPIAQAAFGNTGLLYASIFLIPQRIAMWSVGLSLFAGVQSKKDVVRKVLTHPCIIALGIGVIVMILSMFGIHLPEVIDQTLGSIANCNTAMSMIVIGAILSDVPFREMKDRLCLSYSLIRDILLPLCILLFCLLIGWRDLGMAICVIESAMPAPSTLVMLAETYDGDSGFASRLVFVSTLLSLVTLPIWMICLSRLIG